MLVELDTLQETSASDIQPLSAGSDPQGCWYVAYTKPRQEHCALQNLEQQGFLAYLPLYKTVKKPGKTATTPQALQPEQVHNTDGALQATYEPMFPRYLFFRPACPQQSIATVRSTRGVNNLIRFGSELATLQPETLGAIQQLEQRRNQAPLQAISPFQPGRRVRLCDPGLHALEGLVHSVSAKRITVLLEILGRQKILRVAHGQLELVQ